MTNMIYRGVKHNGQRIQSARKPQNLIYRGVAHDGLSTAARPSRQARAAMSYRGVAYSLGANGIEPHSPQDAPSYLMGKVAT